MSRNFELLQHLGIASSAFATAARDSAVGLSLIKRSLDASPMQSAADADLEALVSRLFLERPHGVRPSALAFCPVEANGAGTLCSRTAELLAARGLGSVCLVDAALDAPSIHEYFGVPVEEGLSDSLVQQTPVTDFAYRIIGQQLAFITAGTPVRQAYAAIGSSILEARIRELRSLFDFVLVAAPAGVHAGVMGLLAALDGVVLVIEAHATRRESAVQANNALRSANVQVLGAVLSNRTFPIPETVYSKLF